MLIKRPESILPSEITDESVYLKRRDLLKVAGMAAVGGTLTSQALFASGSTSGISGRELSDGKAHTVQTRNQIRGRM